MSEEYGSIGNLANSDGEVCFIFLTAICKYVFLSSRVNNMVALPF